MDTATRSIGQLASRQAYEVSSSRAKLIVVEGERGVSLTLLEALIPYDVIGCAPSERFAPQAIKVLTSQMLRPIALQTGRKLAKFNALQT